MKYLLADLEGILDDNTALAVICKWVDGNVKYRAHTMASVLPNDLNTMTKWISLYHEKNKANIALALLDNVLTGSIEGTHEEHYRHKLDEVITAKSNTDNPVVLDWLKGYEAALLFRLGEVLQFQMFDAFGVGKIETIEEENIRDLLRQWLGNHIDIKNIDVFLHKFDNEKDGNRRLDGNVWHGELIKLFYEDGTFPIAEVEYKRKIKGKTIDIDIKLIDQNNIKEQINIQAWYGMSKIGHGIWRTLNTGTSSDMSGFTWSDEYATLQYKINQLPKRGQNFVINRAPNTSPTLISSHNLLTNRVCVMQVRDSHVNIHYLSSFKYKKTAHRIAEILGRKSVILEDDWANGPDGMSKLTAATYGFDPHKEAFTI